MPQQSGQSLPKGLPFYNQARKYVLKCFSNLYHAPNTLLQFSNWSITKGKDFIQRQFAWASEGATDAIYGGAGQIVETCAWTGKKMQAGVDYTVESIRQQQKFAVNSVDTEALSWFIAGATLSAIPAFQAINDKGARSVLLASFGFMFVVGGIVGLDKFFDLEVERETLEAGYRFAHDAAISIMKFVIAAEMSTMFAISMKATAVAAAGVATYNPITAAIISSILAAVLTTAIMGRITYYEKLVLPRDTRNLFFDSPAKELEELYQKKEDYIKALLEANSLTDKQKEVLKAELAVISYDIHNFKNLEGQLERCKAALKGNDSIETRENYNAAKVALAKMEGEYFARKERESVVKDFLFSTAVNLFKNLLPGTYIGFILSNSVEHILNETLHLSPQNIYNVVKEKVIEGCVSAEASIQAAVEQIQPVMASLTGAIKTTVLGSEQLMKAATSFIVEKVDKDIVRPLVEEKAKLLEVGMYNLAIDIRKTAYALVDKMSQAIRGVVGIVPSA